MLVVGGAAALLALAVTAKAEASPKNPAMKEPGQTDLPMWVRWQVQQARASEDPALLRAVARVLDGLGWTEQGQNLRAYADEIEAASGSPATC